MATYPTEYRYKIGDKVLVKNDLHEALTYSDSYKMRSGPRAGGWASCTKRHLSFAGAIVTIKSYKMVDIISRKLLMVISGQTICSLVW